MQDFMVIGLSGRFHVPRACRERVDAALDGTDDLERTLRDLEYYVISGADRWKRLGGAGGSAAGARRRELFCNCFIQELNSHKRREVG